MYVSPTVIVGIHVVGEHEYQSSMFELVDQELFTLLALYTCVRVMVVVLCVCVCLSVCVSVCVSVTMLTATYLLFSSKFRCH